MRLHRLEVQAFQAFAGREQVDFDALAEAGLFLLHGETGAGKTSLLDAVVFALYGELPGARGGRGARVRSDHAAPGLRTEVELEATLRGERIRIVRTPKQERPKLRGEGVVEDAATVLLEAIAADGTARTLATRADEAGHELDRLLGMSREQFCQVVLLPQGEFATFLRAESDERERLLERIFSAGRFRGAEHWLAERRKASAAALEASLRSVRDVASAVAELSGAVPPDGWEDDPALLTAWVDDAHVVAEAELATAGDVAAAAAAARAVAERVAREAAELGARRRRHAAATAALSAIEAQGPLREAWAAELARARTAAGVAPLLAVLDEQSTALAEAREAVTAAGVAPGAEAGAFREAVAGAQRRAGEVAALRETEQGIAVRRDALAERRRGLEDVRRTEATARAALAAADPVRERLVEEHGRAQLAAALLPGARRDADAAAVRHAAALLRDAAAERLTALTTAYTTAVAAEQAARERWLDLREQRLAGMAAELAGGLVDGEPCVVCGSVEHPAPAAPSDADGGVSAQDERVGQAAVEDAGRAVAAIAADVERERAALAGARATAGDVDVLALLQAAQDAARIADEHAAGAEVAAATAAALEAHEAAVAAHTSALSGAERAAVQLDTWIAGEEHQLAVDGAALDAALDGASSVAERLAALEAEATAAETGAAALDAVAAGQRAVAQAEQRAAGAAHAAGFEAVDAARAAVRSDAECASLEGEVRRYDEELARCRAAVADPELVVAAAAELPDVPALTAAAGVAVAAESDATGAVAVVRRRAERLDVQRTALAMRLEAFGPAAAQAARVRALSHLVDGTSTQNRKRMRLSAYVLAARLEEIAAAASVRLGRMSGGRYVLEHRDEGLDGRRRAGLGLVVIDAWTGRERSPRTLSGGETFLASLALALGLADVVAAEAGGARLETLFVDEGFGSLDEQTLDEVLDVLDRLREGGRAVGVVSHVGELRDRVSARLFVEKGRAGSRVRQAARTG